MAEKKPQKKSDLDKMNFEQAIHSLQEIVEKVENGQIGLEDAIDQYEVGCKLVGHCKEILETAERKIEILSKGLDGDLKAKPFEPEPDINENEQ